MKIVVQRTKRARVIVNDKTVGEIPHGMLLLVCFEKDDSEDVINKSAQKIGKLRLFEDPETKKMSWDISQTNGQFLAVSQFTLSWNGTGGNRPGFDLSMEPGKAQEFFNRFANELSKFAKVETGLFGEDMQIELINDGPVTFSLHF